MNDNVKPHPAWNETVRSIVEEAVAVGSAGDMTPAEVLEAMATAAAVFAAEYTPAEEDGVSIEFAGRKFEGALAACRAVGVSPDGDHVLRHAAGWRVWLAYRAALLVVELGRGLMAAGGRATGAGSDLVNAGTAACRRMVGEDPPARTPFAEDLEACAKGEALAGGLAAVAGRSLGAAFPPGALVDIDDVRLGDMPVEAFGVTSRDQAEALARRTYAAGFAASWPDGPPVDRPWPEVYPAAARPRAMCGAPEEIEADGHWTAFPPLGPSRPLDDDEIDPNDPLIGDDDLEALVEMSAPWPDGFEVRKIAARTEDGWLAIEAAVRGVFAVHPSIGRDRPWSVTHVPSGIAVLEVDDRLVGCDAAEMMRVDGFLEHQGASIELAAEDRARGRVYRQRFQPADEGGGDGR